MKEYNNQNGFDLKERIASIALYMQERETHPCSKFSLSSFELCALLMCAIHTREKQKQQYEREKSILAMISYFFILRVVYLSSLFLGTMCSKRLCA